MAAFINTTSHVFTDALAGTAEMGLLESTYKSLHSNLSDFHLVVTCSLLVQFAAYVATSLPGLIFQFIPAMKKYKVQPNYSLPLAEQWECLKLVAFSHTCIYAPLIYVLYQVTLPLDIPRDWESIPAWTSYAWKIVVAMLMEDSWHYWAHRALHHPKLYWIHKLHHKYTSPFPLAAEYAHPIETVVLGIGFFIPMLFFCDHLYFFWVWLAFRMLQTTDVHSGYHFPWINPLYLLPWYGGVRFHDHHHQHAWEGNFASTFLHWDYFFGTDGKYRDREEKAGRMGGMLNFWYDPASMFRRCTNTITLGMPKNYKDE